MEALEGQEELFFSDLLRQFRRRKNLTQQHLAERLGVTRETVSLWERRNYKPDDEVMLYEIVNVLRLTDQEQARLFEAYTVTALATSFHHPPAKRNPYFTGRSAQLSQLHTLLSAGKQVALTQAISGLGGIGKTQLALEYAYRYQKSYHDVFWANGDTEEALMASYVQFAEVLHLSEVKEANQNKIKEAVRRWFQQHTNWLLIFDNIEDLHLLPSFVPDDRQGAVLLTTRRQVTEPAAQTLELAVLSEDEAALFLLKRTKVLALDASLEDASDNEVEAARAITRLLDNLPLALDQAGAYILETRCSFAEYVTLFRTYRDRLLQRRIGESIPTDHPDSVTTTFRLNFEQVQQRNRAAVDLLRLCAYLAPDAIAEEILTEGAALLGSVLSPIAGDAFLLNQAIESLQAFSLVRRDSEKKVLLIHRLVQAVLQGSLEKEQRRMWAERAVLCIHAAFPDVKLETWHRCERMLPHALLAAQLLETYQISNFQAGEMLYLTAWYLKERARYQGVEQLYRRSLHIQEQILGLEHPQVAYPLNGLAIFYLEQDQYAEAESLFQRALRICEQQLEPVHPLMVLLLSNLAELSRKQGNSPKAELLFQRALYTCEQQCGSRHLQMAHALDGLALLYSDQGKYAKAEPLFQRALEIREQHLGPEHSLVAHPLNGLANLYSEQGKYVEAEPLYRRALSIWEQQLGPEHSLVAHPLNNLAGLFREQGRDAEAEPLYQRALSIWEQQLGPEHLLVAAPLTELADLSRKQGKYTEAEPLFRRALNIQERVLGPEHPYRAYPLGGLANLYADQGKYAEAEQLYQRALSIREQLLGPEHPETAETLHDLATLRERQGNLQKAFALYQQALSIREQVFGPAHPKTSTTRERLTALKQSISQEAGAAPQDDISPEQHE